MDKYKIRTSGWWFVKEKKVSYQECFILADRLEETDDAYLFYNNSKNVFEVTKFVITSIDKILE
ncbi:hypothetical protein H8D91_01410 [archaeon]|nr:hypothetical protein [archaeon]